MIYIVRIILYLIPIHAGWTYIYVIRVLYLNIPKSLHRHTGVEEYEEREPGSGGVRLMWLPRSQHCPAGQNVQ